MMWIVGIFPASRSPMWKVVFRASNRYEDQAGAIRITIPVVATNALQDSSGHLEATDFVASCDGLDNLHKGAHHVGYFPAPSEIAQHWLPRFRRAHHSAKPAPSAPAVLRDGGSARSASRPSVLLPCATTEAGRDGGQYSLLHHSPRSVVGRPSWPPRFGFRSHAIHAAAVRHGGGELHAGFMRATVLTYSQWRSAPQTSTQVR